MVLDYRAELSIKGVRTATENNVKATTKVSAFLRPLVVHKVQLRYSGIS
jgi:hypothetical protein